MNNACFAVLGIALERDNDYTGATAGSIVGAAIGKSDLPKHWRENYNSRMHSCFYDCPAYIDVDDLYSRFERQEKLLTGGQQNA